MIKKLADGNTSEDEEKEVEIDEDGNVVEDEEKEEEGDKTPDYIKWYENFGPSIKMGIIEDDSNRKKLAKLVRVKTTKSDGEYVSLDQYVEGMKEWQDEIFYLAGMDEKELKKSDFLEKFVEKDLEVIMFSDPIDEYMVQRLSDYEGKKFSIISKETIKFGDEDKDLESRISAAYTEKYDSLIKFLNKFYGKTIFRSQISKRLGSAAAIVSSSEFGHSANMERIMNAQVYSHGGGNSDRPGGMGMRTLELNPRHPIVDNILSQIPDGDGDAGEYTPEIMETVSQELKDTLWTLLDTALLNGGFPINEGKAFTKRMTRILKSQLGVEASDLLPEIEPKEVEEDVPPESDDDEFDLSDLNLDEFGEE